MSAKIQLSFGVRQYAIADGCTLVFLLPSNFNNSACDSLGGMLHEYIVDRTLSEWFVITSPNDAQNYSNLATDALDRAKQALYKRERPTRPTYND